MASVKKITMHEYNGTDYDTLYPKTIASQVDGVYNKTEIDAFLAKKVPVLNRETSISSDDDLLSRIETAAATIWANNQYGGAAFLPIHFDVKHPILGAADNMLFIRCVDNTQIEVTAIIVSGDITTTVHRFKATSGWGPFEYENPPMALDVEYRTTERCKGKPVYKMLVSCGSMPNNGEKGVNIGSYETSNQIAIIDVKAWMSYASDGYGTWSMSLPYMSNDDTAVSAIACGVATGVRFEAKKSYGDNYYGFAIASYIKTYD